MEAVVMAAGEGTRLPPLTERWPKPVLPLDGRPVIGTLVHDLAAPGIERFAVGPRHLAAQGGAAAGPLADVFQLAIDDGASVSAIQIGRTRDITSPVDLVRENHPYLR